MEFRTVEEFIRNEIDDWDDEVMVNARFKAFGGQRSDWEPKYIFWRDLIIKIARHLNLFVIRKSEIKNVWFCRKGLTPLCLDDVLTEMYKSGDIVKSGDLADPTAGSKLFQIFRKVLGSRSSSFTISFTEDHLIASELLKEKASEVMKDLSGNHSTSSCIITMKKLQELSGGSKEAFAILSHMSVSSKAKYLQIDKKNEDVIEGVKISLTSAKVPNTTSVDLDVLHLTWTKEKLEQQLNVIDKRCEDSRKLAISFLRSGNKMIAKRHAGALKMSSESRDKCGTLLNRVEEILGVISDTASTKEVVEAIKIGATAIKGNTISLEEVEICLNELDESIEAHKQITNVLEPSSLSEEADDEDIEDEFRKLEIEVGGLETSGTDYEPLTNAFSKLNVKDDAEAVTEPVVAKARQPILS